MRKIPTIFQRDWAGDKSKVIYVRNDECLWVFSGEGVPTRKFDGTAVLVENGQLFVRYDAKHGKTPPPTFHPAQPEPDRETGHWPGWVPADTNPQYKWQLLAFSSMAQPVPNGTYEVCGPHFQGNPEHFFVDTLLFHGAEKLIDAPRTFNELREYFLTRDIEGIVWHHSDGRMAKIKARDFGIKRGVRLDGVPAEASRRAGMKGAKHAND